MEVMKPTSDALRPTCNSTIHHRHLTIPKEAFEIRVIYIRAVSSSDMQKTLKITFPERDPKTCLQLNGLKIDSSEKISRSLNRHRADALMSESIYVNTDRIKFSGPSLPFEVGQVGESAALVAGVVRRVGDDGKGGPDGGDWMWVMECREGGIKEVNGGLVDVYFAGRSLGRPLLLNGVVELKRRLKGLDCIPEGDEMAIDNFKDTGEKKSKELDENPLQEEEEETEMFTSRDEEEVTWFNAGVRVGMGLGLGMCLGIGLGLGLVIRTYQTTAGAFRRFI